jgi:hypothetical protein
MRVAGLFVAITDWIFTIFVDGGLLQLLGVAGGQVGGPLNRSVTLEHHVLLPLHCLSAKGGDADEEDNAPQVPFPCPCWFDCAWRSRPHLDGA